MFHPIGRVPLPWRALVLIPTLASALVAPPAASAAAAEQVVASATAPSTAAGDGFFCVDGSAAATTFVSSFTAAVSHVGIPMRLNTYGAGVTAVQIRTLSGGPGSAPTNTVLASATVTHAQVEASNGFVDIPLNKTVKLIGGTGYAINFGKGGPPCSDASVQGTSYSSDQVGYRTSGVAPLGDASFRFAFTVYGTDAFAPVTTDNLAGLYATAPKAILTATDEGRGVAQTRYAVGESPTVNSSSALYDSANPPSVPDGQRIAYYSTDLDGNAEAPHLSAVVRVDTTAPITIDDVSADWKKTTQPVTLTATDAGSGVSKTYYAIGLSPTVTASSTVYDPAKKPTLANGERIAYLSVDKFGNTEFPKSSKAAKVDGTAPVTTDDVPTGWVAAPYTVTLTAVDGGASPISNTTYEIVRANGTVTEPRLYTPTLRPTLGAGETLRYRSLDVAGNLEATHTAGPLKLDGTLPTTTDDLAPGWHGAPQVVTLSPSDEGGSGLSNTTYEIVAADGTVGDETLYTDDRKPTLGSGERLRYRSLDVAGNREQTHETGPALVDTTAPVTAGNVPTGWQNGGVEVNLVPSDGEGSGVATTYYAIGPDPVATTESSVYHEDEKPVLQDGDRIAFFSVDEVGNAEEQHVSDAVQVDGAAPSTTDDVPAAPQDGPVQVTLTAQDAGPSGVAGIHYEVGTAPEATEASPLYDPANKPVLEGGQKISYLAVDVAGNVEATKTSPALVVKATPPPATPEPIPTPLPTTPEPIPTTPTPPSTTTTPGPPTAMPPVSLSEDNTSDVPTLTLVTGKGKANSRNSQLLLNKDEITIHVSCGASPCTITARGEVKIGSRSYGRLSGPKGLKVAAHRTVTLSLKSSLALRRKVRAALVASPKQQATMTINAAFKGKTKTRTKTLKIKVRVQD